METIDAKLVWKGLKKDNTFSLCFINFEKETAEIKKLEINSVYKLPKSLFK